MSVIWDYEASARDDPLVSLVVNAMDVSIAMMTPERAMILIIFPFSERPTYLMRKVNILCTLQY
jgi:hypothetical protein